MRVEDSARHRKKLGEPADTDVVRDVWADAGRGRAIAALVGSGCTRGQEERLGIAEKKTARRRPQAAY